MRIKTAETESRVLTPTGLGLWDPLDRRACLPGDYRRSPLFGRHRNCRRCEGVVRGYQRRRVSSSKGGMEVQARNGMGAPTRGTVIQSRGFSSAVCVSVPLQTPLCSLSSFGSCCVFRLPPTIRKGMGAHCDKKYVLLILITLDCRRSF